MTPVWWTAADQAELEVLVNELVEQAWPHRGKLGFERAMAEAVEAVLSWRRGRALKSRAAWLRAEQSELEIQLAEARDAIPGPVGPDRHRHLRVVS